MTYKEEYVDLTDRRIFSNHGDEICKMCPWNKELHHTELVCEAYHCEEAMELFLEKKVGFVQIKLEEIRERAEKATAGPWEFSIKDRKNSEPRNLIEVNREEDKLNIIQDVWGREDAEFIAHARQDIPYLLEALQQAQEELNRSEEEWELKVLKRITYCDNEPNKSLVKINQQLKMELQQSRARERVFQETLKNLYLI